VNKKSAQKSAINGLVTAIAGCYINLNFTDSGKYKFKDYWDNIVFYGGFSYG